LDTDWIFQLWYICISGKVHGSLARAGKVRGQTPKVAKQDKKKKPKGRAHKRMQYNRRFVTAGRFLSVFVFDLGFSLYRFGTLIAWDSSDLNLMLQWLDSVRRGDPTHLRSRRA